jgi:hypothetical protein
MEGKLFLIFVTTTILVIGLSSGAPQGDAAQAVQTNEEPPMFTAHDFASGVKLITFI